ncbi:hypothetical protein [Siccirubricoccus sp. G192]|uniref:hypothetical protein n=1 Tax=Siccirubricoccus sp. G192 TaxID=2849651 RepID=UPI001C2C4B5E|nr:hypothetical protein [Siccirubricoccus sp. G192]MBV1800136.1 hypothetical protein [Siccirubricoccus sp. G192]
MVTPLAFTDAGPDGSGLALSNSLVAENQAGAVIGMLTVAAPVPLAVSFQVLGSGGLPDSRFEVDVSGGAPALRLKPGIALDFEAASQVPLTLRASFTEAGMPVTLQRSFTLGVLDRDDPVVITPGGQVSGTLTEDQNMPAPPAPPILTTSGQFGFTDQDAGSLHGVRFDLKSVVSSEAAVGPVALGTFSVTHQDTGPGTGQVTWNFAVDDRAIQQLGAGDTLTQVYSVSVGTNAAFAASPTPAIEQHDQRMAALAGGGFVLVWTGIREGEDFPSVHARLFDAGGHATTDEFRVNTSSPELGAQTPTVAALSSGGFVVLWRSDGDAGPLPGAGGGELSYAVSGQVFNAGGVAIGTEFLANTTLPGNQDLPEVIDLADDRFLVTWRSQEERDDPLPGNPTSITSFLQGQIFETGPDGATKLPGPDLVTPAESRITPDQAPTGESLLPDVDGSQVIGLAGGGFVAVWNWAELDTGFIGVIFQMFDSQGQKLGVPVYANDLGYARYSADQYGGLCTTPLADGGFVLCWQSGGGASEVCIRLFNADCSPRGDILLVGGDLDPVLAVDLEAVPLEGGGFVVIWQGLEDSRVRGQVFSADGMAVGNRFEADGGDAAGLQYGPRVAATAGGGFTILWSELGGQGTTVFAQAYTALGTAEGAGFPVSPQGQGTQELGEIMALPGGGVVATWLAVGYEGTSLLGQVVGGGAGGARQDITITIQGVNDRPTAVPLIANPVPLSEAGFGVEHSSAVIGRLATAGVLGDADAGGGGGAAGDAGRPAGPAPDRPGLPGNLARDL